MASKSWGEFSSYWFGCCKDTLKQLLSSDQSTCFSEGLLYTLCYETDVGCIPRGIKLDTTKTQPKYFQSENWNKQLDRCYWCRDDSTSYNGICSSTECFFYLHDWCVGRVVYFTGRRFCRLPGCVNNTYNNQLYCNSTDKAKFDSLFPKGSDHEYTAKTVIREGPSWYNSKENDPSQQPNCGPNFIFSSELTQYLYYQTDVGLIPREIRSPRPPPASLPLINWNISITMCYWCCQGNRIFNTVACSHRCLFFFNEWLHKIYETSSHRQLCKHIGCNSLRYSGFQCCNREHSSSYDLSFKQFYHSLKSTEFALGPVWYTHSINQIEFYNIEDPFYEFTNFYLCDVYIDGLVWRTSEHYFQAMKFYGTPYFKYVSTMTTPRDAFQFSRTPEATRWLHPQWPSVKLQVMLNVLRVKFSSHNLRTILLRTGNAILVEHTRNDTFWGDGGDGRGENRLGILLMQVRREFQAADKYPVYQQNPMFQNNINNQTLFTCEANNPKYYSCC